MFSDHTHSVFAVECRVMKLFSKKHASLLHILGLERNVAILISARLVGKVSKKVKGWGWNLLVLHLTNKYFTSSQAMINELINFLIQRNKRNAKNITEHS